MSPQLTALDRALVMLLIGAVLASVVQMVIFGGVR
jgi:hypothetical protein